MFKLTSPSDLKQQLSTEHPISIIDARRRYEFNAGHIPGAICMRWEHWCEAAPENLSNTMKQPGWWGRLEEAPEGKIAERLGALGLSTDQQIIVYADGARTKGRDARIAWMLLYYGAKNVSLLNGGWKGWKEISGRTQTEISLPVARNFHLQLSPERRISLSNLRDKSGLVAVDTRTVEEFAGEIYDYQPRKGRIPNSLSRPFKGLFDDNGYFIDRAQFLNFAHGKLDHGSSSDGGISVSGKVRQMDYSYCEVGVRAAAFSLLYELYTGTILPVHDGSFMEWSHDNLLDIERG